MQTKIALPPDREGWLALFHDTKGLAEFHSHPELEFNIVTNGSAYYIVDSRRILVSPGTLIWLFPQQEHLLVEVSSDFAMWVAVLSPAVCRRIAAEPSYELMSRADPGTVLARRLNAARVETLVGLCATLRGASDAPIPLRFNRGLEFLLMEAWEAYTGGEELTAGADLSPVVASCLRLIAKHAGQVRVGLAADEFGVSASWLSRSFHREAGVRFVDYCNRLKLMRFEELRSLRPGSTITSLAFDAGFGSYAQFYRVYRAAFGSGPDRSRRFGTDLRPRVSHPE